MKPIYAQIGIAGAVFLIGLAAYLFVYVDVQSESAKAAGLAAEIQDKSQTSTRVSQAKSELAQLAPQEASINQYFVSPTDIVPFLEQFGKTGDFLGAKVDVVSVSATPGKPYGTLSLSVKITGSFEAVMRTLGSIEYGPYDITTNSVTLSSSVTPNSGSTPTTGKPVWTATLTLTIGTQASVDKPAAPAQTSVTSSEATTNTVPVSVPPVIPAHASSTSATTTRPTVSS